MSRQRAVPRDNYFILVDLSAGRCRLRAGIIRDINDSGIVLDNKGIGDGTVCG